MIIAVDGPAGTGKSTVCKLLAEQLQLTYLDTGAMYRAVAFALLRQHNSCMRQSIDLQHLAALPLSFQIVNGALDITYEGKRVGDEIREPGIAEYASRISQMKPVRDYLTQSQRQLAKQGNIIAEGRDTTSVVFPDASVKIFLTASLSERAARRYKEYLNRGISTNYEAVEAQIRARDEADANREVAPLQISPGVRVVDTSGMGIGQVVARLKEIITEEITAHDQ